MCSSDLFPSHDTVHNIEETPEIKIGDYVEIASRVMDDKILIPEFLKNGETK